MNTADEQNSRLTVHHVLDQVYESIRGDILSGELGAGERLHEEHLSRSLGVSRTPVREAIRRLEREGLVTVVPYRGAHVVNLDLDQIEDLFDAREAIEGMAARLAAERMPEEEIAWLVASVDAPLPPGDVLSAPSSGTADIAPDLPARLPLDFHQEVVRASRNASIIDAADRLQGQLVVMRMISSGTAQRHLAARQEHRAIAHCIAAHDASGAEAAMRHHIRNGKTNLLRIRSVGQGPRQGAGADNQSATPSRVDREDENASN